MFVELDKDNWIVKILLSAFEGKVFKETPIYSYFPRISQAYLFNVFPEHLDAFVFQVGIDWIRGESLFAAGFLLKCILAIRVNAFVLVETLLRSPNAWGT